MKMTKEKLRAEGRLVGSASRSKVIFAKLLLAIAIAVTLASVGRAKAQDWPVRSVTMVVPVAAGSSSDIIGRILAQRVSELLGQPVIVENAGGAGGTIGAHRVAVAAPDGYLFAIGNAGTHAVSQTLYKHPLYNPATDFAPVALVAEVPHVLLARKDLPASNLQEFIAYAKANQTKMQYGSPGAGSVNHLACALLNLSVGIDVTHIPYRTQIMPDLIAGRLDYWCPTTTVAIPQIGNQTVNALAILTMNRSPNLPDLPTAHEQGLTNFDAATWNAFFLPKGTPAAIVRKLNAATVKAMETPFVQQRLSDIGATIVEPERRSPAYLQKFVESEIAKWAGPIKASGLSMD
jgi:tripartite-type tricarboxylate transporter receptor subunit TctC